MQSGHGFGARNWLTESPLVATRWRGLTFTRERVIGVAAIVVLIILGVVLPYVTITYINDASESVIGHKRLTGAGNLIGGIDPTYLPGYQVSVRRALTLGLNIVSFGIGLQQIGSVVAVATVVGQFFDEINKFLWWPLHLSGYALVLTPVPLFIGVHLLQVQNVSIHLGPAWVPAVLAGAIALVMTFRSWKRIDSYGGI